MEQWNFPCRIVLLVFVYTHAHAHTRTHVTCIQTIVYACHGVRESMFVCVWVDACACIYTWIYTHQQWRKQVLRVSRPELIRINWIRAKCGLKKLRDGWHRNFAAYAAKFWKPVFRRKKHFRGVLAIILVTQLPPKRCFGTQELEFTSFWSTVSSQRRVTCSDVSFQTK